MRNKNKMTDVLESSWKRNSLRLNIAQRRFAARLLFVFALTVLFGFFREASAQCIGCTVPTFEPAQTYSNFSTDGVAVGDFNNDGKADLVAFYGGYIKILPGNGLGGFGPPILTTIVFHVNDGAAPATADFNHDGSLDVMLTGDGFCIFLGDGTGHFGPLAPEGYAEGYYYSDNDIQVYLPPAIGDFNNDNMSDVLYRDGRTAQVYLGDGIGAGFVQSYGYGFDPEPVSDYGFLRSQMATADFNGDGNLDFITQSYIYLGDGTGNFTLVSSGLNGFFVVADFNGDGKPDIAEADPGDDPNFWGVRILMGNGTANFTSAGFLRVGPTQNSLFGLHPMYAADINGDGKIDLVTCGYYSIFILPGDGNGSFGTPVELAAGMSDPYSLAFGDFNGDGRQDIVFTSAQTTEDWLKGTVLLNSTYQTAVGVNSTVAVGNTSFTFDNVTAGGTTTLTPIDPASIGQVPGGFAVSNSVAYEIATTASFIGSVTLAFKVPDPISEADFNTLAILHNVNGTLVDVTATTPARDYATRTIYATTTSFSPFYLARRGPHINALFDQTKAYKSGSTIPVKLQVLSSSNANTSSAGTSLVARDLRLMSGNTSAPVLDSGNANPDYTFRYDATLGGAGGGYIFNLSTKGLASGQYVLSFYVGSDHSFFYTVKFEVK
jgi:hypothetical protein